MKQYNRYIFIKKLSVFLLLAFQFFSSYTQQISLNPRVEFFSIPNSAINSEEISDIKVDSEGYVWIVSFKGLYRYDGERFQKISANYNSFGSLIRFYEGNNGERFVIDYWGATYFVDNDSLFEYPHNAIIRSYYKAYGYSDIKYIDSALHFSYNVSSYKISKGENVEDPLEDKRVKFKGIAVRMIPGDKPFVFSGNQQNKDNDSYSFYIYNNNFELLDSVKLNNRRFYNPSSLVYDSTYLLSNGKGNLIEFDETSVKRVIQYPDQIISLFYDNSHNLWISTRGKGVHFYKNGKIDYPNKKVILPNSTTIVSAQDYQGGIWLYSQEKGIGYISHPGIRFLEREAKVKPLVEALVGVKNKIVFGYGSELESVISEGKRFELGKIANVGKQIMRLSYDEVNERLWVSARQDLFYLDDEKETPVSVKLNNEFSGSFSYLNSVWDDSTISLIGTNGYQYFICYKDSIGFVSERYDHKLKGVMKYKDVFYVNTGNGIYVKSNDTAYYLGDEHQIAKKSASQLMLLNNRPIFSIPSEGVYLYNENQFIPIEYNNEVIPATKLVKENDSTLWAVSNYGCFKVSFHSNSNKNEVLAFSALPRMVLKAAAIQDNKLFLQTRNSGIGIIELEEIINSQLASPKLLITKVQIKDKSYFERYDIDPISYSENNIQISFKSLNFHDLDVSYRYKLSGSGQEWTTTLTGFVNYVSLAPNDYTFEVQSRYGLGKWSKSKLLKFKIIPPIWQRWWFIVLLSIVLLIIIYQSINYRFRIINREKSLTIGRLTAEQKALRAKMDPHFMFNVISSLQYLILRKKNDTATLFLNKFSKLLRNTLNQSDKEYISIKEEVQFLTEYIELEKMRLENAFDYLITIPKDINQHAKIPTFIIQPFIENSIQHGLKAKTEKGLLTLNFSIEGKFLKVEIIDNGVGYNTSIRNKNKAKKYVSHGIHTIKERLVIYNERTVKEDISVIDLSELDPKETGTKVEVYLKLKQQ